MIHIPFFVKGVIMDTDWNKIIVVGDVHGEWKLLDYLIKREKPSIVLQTRDFGWFPHIFKFNLVLPDGVKLYWCDANHECFFDLNYNYTDAINEVAPNVFYMRRCSVLTINDKNIMFLGGADSIDKGSRTLGIDWFPEEVITMSDLKDLDLSKNIDIVISHTCPLEFNPIKNYYGNDPSREACSFILKHFKPKYWFFGHWHVSKYGTYKKCKWWCLNDIRRQGGFINLGS